MCVDMHHAYRLLCAEGLENRVRDRVVAAGTERQDTRFDNMPIESRDFGNLRLEVVSGWHLDIAYVGDTSQLVGIDVCCHVEDPHQAGRVTNFPRPVARPGTVGDAKIRRYADERDVEIFKRLS